MPGPTSLFDRIVVGVDGTPESLEAARQGARLRAEDGTLHLFSAVYLAGAVAAGWSAPRIAEELEREAGAALRRAQEVAGEDATSRLVNGPAVRSLLREVEDEQATLLCVGSHERSRLEGMLFDYVGTTMLHEAPCAVLVAREPPDRDVFPRTIVAGVDGSAQAGAAHAAAEDLAERFSARLTTVAADTKPVDAIVEAADGADLIVVGSRGVGGLRALGSVSERVAHRAACSVLVVRGPGIGEAVEVTRS
ncbi:MAG TPA: universal stress protein [Gaiellaceae bacterium]|nr:universal stress protein [Gaiellaceae bacterium]